MAERRSTRETRCTWSVEDDETLKCAVEKHGTKSWAVAGTYIKGKTGKQCRERWTTTLDPRLRQEPWNAEEDAKLVEAQAKYGGRWSKIVRVLPGRTEVGAKHRWALLCAKKTTATVHEVGAKRHRSPGMDLGTEEGASDSHGEGTLRPLQSPRPATSFFHELASPRLRAEHVLASPTKKLRNMLLATTLADTVQDGGQVGSEGDGKGGGEKAGMQSEQQLQQNQRRQQEEE